ncbi:MAG: GNAT family N-acetyltransferase [Lachnospiraceae bacterium]
MLREDNDKILNCEIEYSKCFSKYFEAQDLMRFRDDSLMDMYDHNFTLIKRSESDDELYHRIESEIQLRRTEGENFCNIASFVPISGYLIEKFETKPQISTNGFYLFDISKLSVLSGKKKCLISKLDNLRMADDLLRLDLELDGARLGVDFCTRRANRLKKVYLSAEGVNSYICYDNNEPVGSCDLFISKDVAKIEDFVVSPMKQRQGYGTIILKTLIEIALNSGVSTIYLVADEDDTAKDMYLKYGFSKIGEKTDLFYRL